MDEEVSWPTEVQHRRRQRAARIGVIAFLVVSLGLGYAAIRSGIGGSGESATPGFSGKDRSIATDPFRLALPGTDGSTTIPGDPFGTVVDESSPTSAPASTTSTTIVIPPPPDDPSCEIATEVVGALRIVTGPDGTTPTNLAATAEQFNRVADTLTQSQLPSSLQLAQLMRNIAVEMVKVTSEDEALALIARMQTPKDPTLRAAAAKYTARLQEACPEILAVEP